LSLSKALHRYISLPIASNQSAQLVPGLGSDKVDAHAIVPLLHNLFTCGHVLQPLDMESGKVPQNGELIHLGEWLMRSVSLPQIFFDLFS